MDKMDAIEALLNLLLLLLLLLLLGYFNYLKMAYFVIILLFVKTNALFSLSRYTYRGTEQLYFIGFSVTHKFAIFNTKLHKTYILTDEIKVDYKYQ